MCEPSRHYAFCQNVKCEYFPCHPGIAEADFNCLFCYCPLYALGKKCGGAFTYTENGFKDCSRCSIPHKKENYDYILSRYQDIMALVRKNDETP
ncbi:MAG: cysteine-rich small domain-containing protein [Clostridia bacterium]|nr:cysteine-rich small domain-containing protein [Clostridia bacterium]